MTYVPAQVVYEIPDVIQAGLQSGILVQYGNIVRDLSGHIVKHLKMVPLKKEAAKTALTKIKDFAKSVIKNPKLLLAALALIGVIIGIIRLINKFAKKGKNVEVPESVVIFNENLKKYLEALENGENNLEVLDNLIESIEKIQDEDISQIVETNIVDFTKLLKSIKKYTDDFAKANNYVYNKNKYKANNIIDFNNCLKLQKQIIKKVS